MKCVWLYIIIYNINLSNYENTSICAGISLVYINITSFDLKYNVYKAVDYFSQPEITNEKIDGSTPYSYL